MGDDAFADGEQGEFLQRLDDREVLLRHTDDEAADGVDRDDDHRGDRVAAHELAGTVHRAVEVRRALDVLAALARFGFGDQPGVEVGVDGKLLAGHRVEGKTRRDFGDASGTVGDHDELDDDQDEEDHEADGIVAADDDLSEELDHFAGVPVQENRARRGDVERQAEQRDDQQHRRKRRERESIFRIECGRDDDERDRDVDGEQNVEQPRGIGTIISTTSITEAPATRIGVKLASRWIVNFAGPRPPALA